MAASHQRPRLCRAEGTTHDPLGGLCRRPAAQLSHQTRALPPAGAKRRPAQTEKAQCMPGRVTLAGAGRTSGRGSLAARGSLCHSRPAEGLAHPSPCLAAAAAMHGAARAPLLSGSADRWHPGWPTGPVPGTLLGSTRLGPQGPGARKERY